MTSAHTWGILHTVTQDTLERKNCQSLTSALCERSPDCGWRGSQFQLALRNPISHTSLACTLWGFLLQSAYPPSKKCAAVSGSLSCLQCQGCWLHHASAGRTDVSCALLCNILEHNAIHNINEGVLVKGRLSSQKPRLQCGILIITIILQLREPCRFLWTKTKSCTEYMGEGGKSWSGADSWILALTAESRSYSVVLSIQAAAAGGVHTDTRHSQCHMLHTIQITRLTQIYARKKPENNETDYTAWQDTIHCWDCQQILCNNTRGSNNNHNNNNASHKHVLVDLFCMETPTMLTRCTWLINQRLHQRGVAW